MRKMLKQTPKVTDMSRHEEDSNNVLFLLAGIGLGAMLGVAAGLLLAPKSGDMAREELNEKFKEFKGKAEDWVSEQKTKRENVMEKIEEIGV